MARPVNCIRSFGENNPRYPERFPQRHALWPCSIRWSNAHAACFYGNDGSLGEFITILREHLLAHTALLARSDIDQAHDATVRQASSDRQFAKILIERDEYTLLPMRLGQDVFIARILGQITGPQHVMAGRLKFRLGSAPDASIEQQIHAADSILRGSIRS